ncbi:unnamed protein product [Lymnaea stagnalis]|uniref:Uncharacterized protein n=1 Tax=Lymnaea stagnalis TaxID=6523 RepID=A0AAV2HQB9_LYMST
MTGDMVTRTIYNIVVAVMLACFLLLQHGGSSVSALTCDGDGPCRCTYSDGSGTVDISSLGRQDGIPLFPDEYAYDGSAYSYNPCFSFSIGSCQDAAVCKKSGTDYIAMGKQSTAVWSYTGYYPRVTFSTSDSRKAEVTMFCGPTYTSPQLDVVGETIPGTVAINMWSVCACPNSCKRVDPISADDGLSPGSVMLIIFFVLLIVYLCGGVAFNYNKSRTVGREMIPNVNFWSALPGLILDGFRLSWDFVCRRHHKDQPYEAM